MSAYLRHAFRPNADKYDLRVLLPLTDTTIGIKSLTNLFSNAFSEECPVSKSETIKAPMLNSIYSDRPELYWNVRECWLNKRRMDHIIQYLKSHPHARNILEIGSGVGGLLLDLAEQFPEHRFMGIEPSDNYCAFAEQLKKERRLSNVHFLPQSSDTLDLHNQSLNKFDLILSNDVLHHIDNWEKLLENLGPYLKSRTLWLTIEPNPYNIYSAYRQSTQPGERIFAKSKFLKIASIHGWKKKSVNFLFLIPPFVKVPSRWMIEMEKKFESMPFLGGGICMELVRSA